MKMIRKTSITVLVLMLLMLALAACNRDDETQPGDTQGNGYDGTPSFAGVHEPRDLGGRTITVGAWWESVIPFAAHNWDEPDPATAGNYYVSRRIFDNSIRVREEFNFVLEEVILDFDSMMPTLTSSIMAGDTFADIALISGGWVLPAIMGDLIIPLGSIDLPGSDLLGPQIYSRVIADALGEDWTFMDSRPTTGGFTVGINMDIINEIGVPNPIDLYNQGLWTWDAMLDIMRTATMDTTGDGMTDRFGISGQPGDLAFYFIGANDGQMVSDDFQYALDHPNTIVALEFLETIFHEGLWEYDMSHGLDVGDWSRNFFAFQNGNSVFFPATTWALSDGHIPFEFAVVPWPLGPGNTSGNTWMGGWDGGFAFPHGSPWDTADLLMVIEEFWAWSGDDFSLMEDYAFGWPRTIFLTEEDIVRQASATFTMASDMGMNVPQYNWIFGTFVNHFALRSMTVQQVVEAYRGPQQEILDNFFR